MRIEIISKSPSQTRKIGEKIGKLLRKGDIVGLTGKLGGGKTTIIQGIARSLGVRNKQYVRSPSFVLVHEYRGKMPVYHIDLYRLSGKEIADLGYEEYLFGEGVCMIEWVEKIRDLLPKKWLHINLGVLPKDNNIRKIKFKGEGRYEEVIKKLNE
jgi:tRNA threonylcarbamoyladenosine biosynthesis protein TsaE